MTQRLYYDNSYLTEFEAFVTACEKAGTSFKISLDQSAFYAASGGQPFDTGRINEAKVLDVFADGQNEVWHITDKEFAKGDKVICGIDWPRRFDHMQQHSGEHILAGALNDLYHGLTHGLHIGGEFSTIDVSMPGGSTRLDPQQCLQLENLTNSRIQKAAPMRSWFPEHDELNHLPLRKPAGLHDKVRIIAAGDFEMVACGGTHVSNTGEIGLIKILNTAPARGKMRVSFVCGKRALEYYQMLMNAAIKIGSALSVPPEDISRAVDNLLNRQTALKEELTSIHREQTQNKIESLLKNAVILPNGAKMVKAELTDIDELNISASSLTFNQDVIALLCAPDKQAGYRIVFGRSKNLDLDMSLLLHHCEAKGGGRPDYAQGSTKDPYILKKAESFICGSEQ